MNKLIKLIQKGDGKNVASYISTQVLANIDSYTNLRELTHSLKFLDSDLNLAIKLDTKHFSKILSKKSSQTAIMDFLSALVDLNAVSTNVEIVDMISKLDSNTLFQDAPENISLYKITRNNLFKELTAKYIDFLIDNKKYNIISRAGSLDGLLEKAINTFDTKTILMIFKIMEVRNPVNHPETLFLHMSNLESLPKLTQMTYKYIASIKNDPLVLELYKLGANEFAFTSSENVDSIRSSFHHLDDLHKRFLIQALAIMNSFYNGNELIVRFTPTNHMQSTFYQYLLKLNEEDLFKDDSLYFIDTIVARDKNRLDIIPTKPKTDIKLSSKLEFNLLNSIKQGSSLINIIRKEYSRDDLNLFVDYYKNSKITNSFTVDLKRRLEIDNQEIPF